MSRPKKNRITVVSSPPDSKSAGRLYLESKRRHADPYNDLVPYFLGPLATILTQKVDLDREDDPHTETGSWLITMIKLLSPEDCKKMFASILKAKENAIAPPSRQSHCLRACAEFIREVERPPTKPELKKYILARADQFADMPSEDDKKGWTRLWEDTNLDGLETATPK